MQKKNPDNLPSDTWYDAIEARIAKLEKIIEKGASVK